MSKELSQNQLNTYCYPKLSEKDFYYFRMGGAGLGNILFPWARSVVVAKKNGYKRINATWRTVKIGPILRGELDSRLYGELFSEKEISGFKKAYLLLRSKKVGEESLTDLKTKQQIIIVFTGVKNMMEDIIDDHEVVKSELMKMIKPENLLAINKNHYIAVHIRMGDFQIPDNEDIIRNGSWNYRLPLQWYTVMVKKIRFCLGSHIPVYVFSDGTDEELQPILDLENVQRKFFGSAISDLIGLSESKALIASASTFSMWASYLGRMPVIWFPGTHRQKLYYDNDCFEGEIDYEDPIPNAFFNKLQEDNKCMM